MPISQFRVRGFTKVCYDAKKISKWHMFLGSKMFDKICHSIPPAPQPIRHKRFRPSKPCEILELVF